jgi:hypothetical protein
MAAADAKMMPGERGVLTWKMETFKGVACPFQMEKLEKTP